MPNTLHALLGSCLLALVGCTDANLVSTSTATAEVENSCKDGDSSHTTAGVVTCAYAVTKSNNDKAEMTAQGPYASKGSSGDYYAACFLSGITCSGGRTATNPGDSCKNPEYAATNQEVQGCPPTWGQALKGRLGEVEVSKSTSNADMVALCKGQYAKELADLNGTANDMCNAAAKKWTGESVKAPVCCIPAKAAPTKPAKPGTTATIGTKDGADDGDAQACDSDADDCGEPVPDGDAAQDAPIGRADSVDATATARD